MFVVLRIDSGLRKGTGIIFCKIKDPSEMRDKMGLGSFLYVVMYDGLYSPGE